MDGLRISLFGKLEVRVGERVLSGFQGHKVQELFGYLLLKRDHPLSRETLGGLLCLDGGLLGTKTIVEEVSNRYNSARRL